LIALKEVNQIAPHPSWTFTTIIPQSHLTHCNAIHHICPHHRPSIGLQCSQSLQACWFLNCKHLISLILAAVKDGNKIDIMWIDLTLSTHTHLLHQAKALAPPSYPLSLLKRVMFTFLLEVVNSWGSVLDKFIKTLALHWHHAPAPAPPSPPALSKSVPVQWDQCHSTDMPVAPMVVDCPPLPALLSYIDHSLPLSVMDQVVLHQGGLEFLNEV